MKLWPAFTLAATVALYVLAPAVGQEHENAARTATVVREALHLEVNIPGVFEADNKSEHSIEPSEYRGNLIITKILSAGAHVTADDVLIEFDTSELDEAIAKAIDEVSDAEISVTKTVAAMQTAEIDYRAVRTQLDTELGIANRELHAAQAQEAVSLAKKEKAVTDAKRNLEKAEEDAQQLIKLYESREHHTATEELMMQRSTEGLQDSADRVQKSKDELAFFKKYEMTKDSDTKEISVSKKETEVAKSEIQLQAELAGKRRETAKAKKKLNNKVDTVKKLEADKQNLRIIATQSGVLFYGTTEGGDGMSMEMLGFGGGNADELKVGGRVKTHSILLTVASMEQLVINMQIMENDVQHLRVDLPIVVRPDAFPNLQLTGKLNQVDHIAQREGFFSDVRKFSVRGGYEYSEVASDLRAGMNCRVTVQIDPILDAIQVPVEAVFQDDDLFYCYVKDGKPSKRKVAIGASNAQSVQIISGLEPGEVVYLSAPNPT